MKVNERRTVVGVVDWPLCVPPTVERDRRACFLRNFRKIFVKSSYLRPKSTSHDFVLFFVRISACVFDV